MYEDGVVSMRMLLIATFIDKSVGTKSITDHLI